MDMISTPLNRWKSSKLNLPEVTLLCIDTRNPYAGFKAISESMQLVDFGAVKFLTNNFAFDSDEKVTICNIPKIKDIQDYSRFCMQELTDFIETPFCLLVQYDGYVKNPNKWTEEFLQYDYIGARWWWRHEYRIGNGGFSMRSKKLLDSVKTLYNSGSMERYHPEDDMIGGSWRIPLQEMGVILAPEDVCYKFSVEGEPYTGQFGWHGYLPNLMKL